MWGNLDNISGFKCAQNWKPTIRIRTIRGPPVLGSTGAVKVMKGRSVAGTEGTDTGRDTTRGPTYFSV